MRVRITGGQFGGRFIKTLPSLRPTSDLVRKAVFDILGEQIEGANFLELFAGCGAVGIEALSRGAKQVLMIEKNRQHFQLVKDNLSELKEPLTSNAVVRQMDVADFIGANQLTYDLVFADPWYDDELDITGWEKLLSPQGILILEYSSKKEPPQNPHLQIINQKRYGDTALAFYLHA
jgi:16S rRNA (guanine966-N2)-methyltransferase